MLNVEELRQILGRPDLADEQLLRMLDDLQCFARVLIEGYLREKRERREKLSRQ